MADDPRAALASLEEQLRELAAELAAPPPAALAAAPPPAAAPVTQPAPVPQPAAAPAPQPAHVPVSQPAAAPAPPRPPVRVRPEVLTAADRVAQAAAPAVPVAPAPRPRGPVAAVAAPPAAPARVDLHAGPFDRPEPLLRFRDAVAALPGVRDAYLRRMDDGLAVIEVTLG